MPPSAHSTLFRREIMAILLLKAILIVSLWCVFFSQPLDKTLTGEQVATIFLGGAQTDKYPLPPTTEQTP